MKKHRFSVVFQRGGINSLLPARGTELLVTILNYVVFGVCGSVDKLLCPVFRFLDWQLDQNSTPCHCHRPACGGATLGEEEEAPDFWTGPSLTLYGRSKKTPAAPSPPSQGLPGSLVSSDVEEEVSRFEVTRRRVADVAAGSRHTFWRSLRFVSMSKTRLRLRAQTAAETPAEVEVVRKQRARKAWWSDCGCESCTSWQSKERLLHVHVDGKDFASDDGSSSEKSEHNVLFIHGFLSSSSFWIDTVLPHLSDEVRSSHRLFAVDVLGFGKSPRPDDCLYTNADHVDMIHRSVLKKYGVKKFHLVAHSMGCTIALALAGQDPSAVQSITLLAPLYFPTSPGMPAAAYVLSNVAPQRVWPFFAFVHSLMSWYEHLGRVVCLVFCKHHRFWVPILAFITKLQGSRMPRSFLHDYMQHSHSSAFKMFHNTICSGPFVMERSMSCLQAAGRRVQVIHGDDDATCPVKCGIALSQQYENVRLLRIPGADHMSVVLGREHDLAKELEAEILGYHNTQPGLPQE